MRRLALGYDEAAEVVGVSRRTLERLVARDAIPYFRLGRKVLFPVRALARWIDAQAAASVSPSLRASMGAGGTDTGAGDRPTANDPTLNHAG